jgi:nucleotide-binding universal stress UspA family protein
MQAGAPVLVAAEGSARLSAEAVIVAWKDTREARRAVSDAMPFLKRARKVVVVAVTGDGAARGGADGLAEVADRLAGHGIAAEVEVAPKGGRSVAEALEDAAGRHGADLIVTGAYGRSRLQEWWLGGVTEDFVAASSKFLLLSR